MNPVQFFKFARKDSLSRREAFTGYRYISPWVIGFLLFTLIPMIATLLFTFTNINLAQEEPLQFVGLKNYETLFNDSHVWDSLLVTIKYGLISLPIGMLLPFSLALLLNSKYVKGQGFFRTFFYMPTVIPFVAAIFAWSGMLNPATGWINEILKWLGVQNVPNWINDPNWVYPSLVILGVWGIGSGMIINLAGLRNIPIEQYEAARVDGAGWWASLFNVTLPLISPVIFYTLVLGVVEVFQYFQAALVLNNGTGDPAGSTLFYNLNLYKTFFTFQDMSLGATMAWLLFIIILAVTLVLFKTQKYWVFYVGEK
jgi:ABC-type sugar transport system permease subunit